MKSFYQKLVTRQQGDKDSYWLCLRRLTIADLQDLAKVEQAPSWNTWWEA
jgi:hypothetical protein